MRKIFMLAAGATLLALASPVAMQAQDKDIVETAVAAGNFKTFTQALSDAGLTMILKGPGPFTVFAPTDDAFAAFGAEKLAALLKDRSALRNVMLYHIVAGKVMAADVAKLDGKGTKTVAGAEARVMVMDGKVMLNSAHIIRSDIVTKNGVIHVIDAVLTPPAR